MTTTSEKVTIQVTKPVVDALKTVARLTPKRSSFVAYEHVRVTAEGNDLTLEAASSEMYYRRTIYVPDMHIPTPVSAVFHRDVLLSAKAPTTLVLGVQPKIGAMALVPAVLPDDFPGEPPEAASEVINCDADYFHALERAAISAAKTESRPVLTGIYHRGDALFSTDGLRAYWATLNVSWPQDLILPATYAATLHRLFDKSGAYMGWNDDYIWYRANGQKMAIRRIHGTYPDVQRVFPTMPKAEGALQNCQAWLDALDEVLTLYKLNKRELKNTRNTEGQILLEGSGDTAVISARMLGSEVRKELPFVTNGSISIRLNAHYLKDAIEQLADDPSFVFYGSDSPFLLQQGHRKALVSPILMR
ncbi:hypothetical protein Alches_17430 [Alicyclobacillus hesperidum subsp. aegles]|uniref:hypothetical protein n=1 Tax=Alicyclobacillus hesperidum TaxID=89784 RepID=UPI00222A2D42|nr:hypothetical protein [Alicyclobacillus hesperidum]GLG01703.1 hypothetical protein Alches_17430 [Alicyclobacillus hesperidum subsp. aegles]